MSTTWLRLITEDDLGKRKFCLRRENTDIRGPNWFTLTKAAAIVENIGCMSWNIPVLFPKQETKKWKEEKEVSDKKITWP